MTQKQKRPPEFWIALLCGAISASLTLAVTLEGKTPWVIAASVAATFTASIAAGLAVPRPSDAAEIKRLTPAPKLDPVPLYDRHTQ